MDKQALIIQIVSRIDDKFAGDTVLFVEQYIETVMQSMSRELVFRNHPDARYLLKTSASLSPSVDAVGRYYVDLSTLTFIYRDDQKFQEVIMVDSDTNSYIAYPVNSWNALVIMPSLHAVPYYRIWNRRLYITSHKGVVTSATITHYEYPTTANYPEHLVDLLVQEFEKYIPSEYRKQKLEDAEKEQGIR